MPFDLEPISPTAPAGTLTSWAEIRSVLGGYNSDAVSQLDGMNGADLDRAADDIADADAYAARRARLSGMTVAQVLGSADVRLARLATSWYAAWLLAVHREWFERNDEGTRLLQGLEARAKRLFDTLFGEDPGGIDGQPAANPGAKKGTIRNVRMVFEPTCGTDEYAS